MSSDREMDESDLVSDLDAEDLVAEDLEHDSLRN